MINIIFACNDDGVIGKDNQLPWKCKNDLKFFKYMTLQNTVVMGLNTFYSLGNPLKDRLNIVVTSKADKLNKQYCLPNLIFIETLEQAISYAKSQNNEIFIIGGKRIIEQSLPFANNIFRTLIHKNVDGDTVSVSRQFENYIPCVYIKTFKDYEFHIFTNKANKIVDKAEEFLNEIKNS